MGRQLVVDINNIGEANNDSDSRIKKILNIIAEADRCILNICAQRNAELEAIVREFKCRDLELAGLPVNSDAVRMLFDYEFHRFSSTHFFILLNLLKFRPECYKKEFMNTEVRKNKWIELIMTFNRRFSTSEGEKYDYSELFLMMEEAKAAAHTVRHPPADYESSIEDPQDPQGILGNMAEFLLEEDEQKSRPTTMDFIVRDSFHEDVGNSVEGEEGGKVDNNNDDDYEGKGCEKKETNC